MSLTFIVTESTSSSSNKKVNCRPRMCSVSVAPSRYLSQGRQTNDLEEIPRRDHAYWMVEVRGVAGGGRVERERCISQGTQCQGDTFTDLSKDERINLRLTMLDTEVLLFSMSLLYPSPYGVCMGTVCIEFFTLVSLLFPVTTELDSALLVEDQQQVLVHQTRRTSTSHLEPTFD